MHYPQTEVIASRAQHLLEWLERHTFPAEIRFADPDHAAAGASFFLDQMLAAGTTTATVFCATAPASADALFAAAETRGLRIVAGKTWMDRNAPAALLDDPESAEADSRALMARWHGRGRLGYAITPRFAITSTPEQLRRAGALAREYPDAWVHSHISESAEEIDAVAELFPEDEDYTSVYARYGLLRKRALYAHGIHLSESELRRFHETGAALVHCPGANTFLGSGLMDLAAARKPDRPVAVGLGSDVGGGTRLSMLCNRRSLQGGAAARRDAGSVRPLSHGDPRRRDRHGAGGTDRKPGDGNGGGSGGAGRGGDRHAAPSNFARGRHRGTSSSR